MSQQLTFADSEFSSKRRQTRKEVFLGRMDDLLPWDKLLGVIEPVYPKAGNGRRPYPLETMLRIHCMQQWYNLSDEAMEDALYEIASMRQFARLSLDKAIPDRTTIMNFRHLLEQHELARKIFSTVNHWLAECGVLMTQGTLVDATIIQAPSSTKNKHNSRDEDMHQTKKGNQWYFGMKAHIGVDADSGLVHTVRGTSGNVADVTEDNNPADALIDQVEKIKASIRAKVEHPFRVIKRQFGFTKVRYRGLKKNTLQIKTLFALSNLWMARHKLMGAQA